MNSSDIIRLLSLAAIWGGSFLFMRVASPVLGSAYLAEGRVLLAAIFLYFLALYLKKNRNLLEHWKHYLIMGFFNSALPFVLFGFAALNLSTSQLSILNATAPIWAFVIGLIVGGEKFKIKRGFGLLLGMIGVGVLFGTSSRSVDADSFQSIALGLGAAFSYGVASNYAKKSKGVEPFDNAHGSMWASAILLIPALFFIPIRSEPTPLVLGAVLAIGIVCSGIAYLLYFRLIKDVGAASALTVTFLIPVFGTLWGIFFLGEQLKLNAAIGMAIIILGTAMVAEFNFRRAFKAI
ncbi:DMT family transporter [Polynucleobacter sp. MWH-Braz-FAM2G]|uniref:DMT family transporter n=1 Tax=Polynucleobacter sp. MWH-Braz-FAM2G TaxID=1855883 RepID=UPI002042226B|nr:DMT family transporter [Polynucleobacter sp. MWH-Braz-FAM2G]QWD90752.1 EamA family transporter [Polynucleobacter sp. MWH-Braz-FAM2G]